MRFAITLAASSALIASVAAIPTITQKGAKFFTSNGNQWFIKGIAYQLTPNDPLIDGNQCALDAALMKTIGTNAIRVYHVDPTADHSSCMNTFSNAGIYLFVDLDTFTTQINPGNPTWNQTQYNDFAAVMDAFQQFDNTAGFFVGNEVLTVPSDSPAAPYVKAAARDMKAYRNQKGYRPIPIGYSAADIASLRPNLQNYLACGEDQSAAIDFFALNAYEWCGQNTYMGSGYSQLNQMAQGYNIPIFFSETGCNTQSTGGRTFGDQNAILGPDMDDTWSGAMIYEWIEEANNYGLISYGPTAAATATGTNVVGGFTVAGTPTPIQPDFSNLSTQWATLNPTGVSMSAYSPSNSPPACPSYTSSSWEVSPNAALPTLGQAAFNAMSGSASATGSGSSRSGTSGSGSATGTAASSRSTGAGAVAAASGTSAAGGASSTAAGSASSAAATKAGASADRQIAGMAAGLVGVMLGFVWWL